MNEAITGISIFFASLMLEQLFSEELVEEFKYLPVKYLARSSSRYFFIEEG